MITVDARSSGEACSTGVVEAIGQTGCEGRSWTWGELARRVLDGHVLTRDEARAILKSPDLELLDLLNAAYRLRHHRWGNEVQLYYLRNAKSGLCQEDCGYCSQSKVSDAPIEKYRWMDEATLLASAKLAAETKARTFCIVASGRGPSDKEVDHVAKVVKKIKETLPLNICCCLGLLEPDQARKLADAGVDRVNHNLNTSRRFYEQICTTHTFDDRMNTLKAVRDAGMELCSGGIVGMGEVDDDVVELALQLRELNVESIPVNFLHAIDGTPLERVQHLNPRYCLKVLALFRFANPSAELRVAGGREVQLRWLQPLALYPANSMFVSDYLTTKGQLPEEDFRMIEDLGFKVSPQGPETAAAMRAYQEQLREKQSCGSNECSGTTCGQ